MRLVGKALARQIPDTTTGHQARTMFGLMTSALANAYATLAAYDSGTPAAAIGAASGILPALGLVAAALEPAEVEAARQYLDDTNAMLARYFAHMPASHQVLEAQHLAELRAAVSTSSVACQQIDELFGTSWLSELVDSLIEAVGTVSAAVANTVAKVAGSFVGGAWWLIALGLGGLWAWHKWGHRVTS